MPREIMRRKAADNKYLHRDFHNTMNLGLVYLQSHYGDDSVREYLRRFALSFYAPLTAALREAGLKAIREHYEAVYSAEEASDAISFEEGDGELTVRVKACPAVAHMRRSGVAPSPLYRETTDAVMRAVCEGTPYAFELVSYDEATGAAVQRFYRKGA